MSAFQTSTDRHPGNLPAAVSTDPTDGVVFARHPFLTDSELRSLLERAQIGFERWRDTAATRRAALLHRMASVLRRRQNEMALMATREMGKPIIQARAEIEKCAALCDWYGENGPRLLEDESTSVEGDRATVSFLPLGTVYAVMPWNFPYWQAMRGAVPIMMGGNGFFLKPAGNVVGSALLLEQAWQEAGLPDGVFTVANLTRSQSPVVIADDRIAAVTLTGGVAAGRQIASQAAAALKKSVLELGGSDPFIVLADADLDAAIRAAVTARFQNCGQVCIAAKRFIIEAPVAERFTERFVGAVKALRVGNPLDENTEVGPMARADLRDELHGQVEASLAAGARLLTGGHAVEGPGCFYAPTVLDQVLPGMQAFDAETFGPVAAITIASDADHAVQLANQSEFGLSGSLWTGDRSIGRRLARRMNTGGVFVNGYAISDPRVPIGGIKKSGYGRELSHFGLREFLNAQTVWSDRL